VTVTWPTLVPALHISP